MRGAESPFRFVALGALAFAGLYVWLDCNALYALRTNQNTGLYLQSLLSFARSGTTFDQSDGRPHLAVHDQWLALPLAPLVALWPHPQTLIVVQVVVLAAAAPVLYRLVRELGGSCAVAASLAFAYLLAPSTQGFAYHGFVPEDAIPLLAFSLAIAIRRRSLVGSLALAVLLLGVKEDQAFFLAWIGAFVAFGFDRAIGGALVVAACASGIGYYAWDVANGWWPERPHYALVDNDVTHQIPFVAEILLPLGFAPLAVGWWVALALPFVAELFLTQDRNYPLYQSGSYYTISFVTLCTVGAAFAVARRPAFARYALAGAGLAALFLNPTVLHFGRRPFSRDPQYAAAARWAATRTPVDFPCEDEGAWTVAAADPNARLACPGTATANVLPPSRRAPRPAWRDVPLASEAGWAK